MECHYRFMQGLSFLICMLTTLGFAKDIRHIRPVNCKGDEHWVRPHTKMIKGKLVPVLAHCRKNPNGYKFWSPKMKAHRPDNWPHKSEKSRAWSVDELESVLDALGRIPQGLWLSRIKGIHRMQKSKDPRNPAASGGGYVVLYNEAFEAQYSLDRLLVHEFAHELFEDLSLEKKLNYAAAAGWTLVANKRGQLLLKPRNCCFVQEDGKSRLDEDFANNIDYFLYEPRTLKEKAPEAYAWIASHFGAILGQGGADRVEN